MTYQQWFNYRTDPWLRDYLRTPEADGEEWLVALIAAQKTPPRPKPVDGSDSRTKWINGLLTSKNVHRSVRLLYLNAKKEDLLHVTTSQNRGRAPKRQAVANDMEVLINLITAAEGRNHSKYMVALRTALDLATEEFAGLDARQRAGEAYVEKLTEELGKIRDELKGTFEFENPPKRLKQ